MKTEKKNQILTIQSILLTSTATGLSSSIVFSGTGPAIEIEHNAIAMSARHFHDKCSILIFYVIFNNSLKQICKIKTERKKHFNN